MTKTVLITGAGGLIGSVLRNTTAERYNIRALSLDPIPGANAITADIGDLNASLAACEGMDSIVHLAANGSERASWDEVLPTNIVGTYNVFEAASRTGVKQVIYASSNHAVGTYDMERDPEIYHTGLPVVNHLVPVRPDGFYGVSKCFGEALGRYYADHRGLNVICLRIGWINRQNTPEGGIERIRAMWLSHRDCVQLIEKSLIADHVKFDIFYGISNNRPHFYDLEHVREIIGYVPLDGEDI